MTTDMKKYSEHISIFGFIGYTMHSFTVLLEATFHAHDISLNLTQFIILNIVNNRKDLILEDLSKLLAKDKSAILRHVNHLEEAFYLAKMHDKKDKRRKVLVITQPGFEVLTKARILEKELTDKITGELTQADMDIFRKVLHEMNVKTMSLIKKD